MERSPLDCRKINCSACCQWGEEVESLRPRDDLPVDENGSCVYLDPKIGCTQHDSKPPECKNFDCRIDIYDQLKDRPLMRVLCAAIKLDVLDEMSKRQNDKESK